jgi:uncharacterized membrane protein
MTASLPGASRFALPRFALIDSARGVAVVAMIFYHFTWDLWAFDLIGADLLGDPVWLAARTAIVSAFLFIAGVCAMLPGGDDAALLRRRFLRLAAAAVAVSVATWIVFPRSWVFFGVLHHLAVAGLLVLPFRRIALPPLLALLGVGVIALGVTQGFEALNAFPLRWIGMGATAPDSNDYVPLFPWFGVVLLGMAAAGPILSLAARLSLPAKGIWAGLLWLGRRSLIIYLLHQPILYGGVWTYVQWVDRVPEITSAFGDGTRAELDFMASCARACRDNGGEPPRCEAACLCARDGLRQADLWRPLLSNALTTTQAEQVERLVRGCSAGH